MITEKNHGKYADFEIEKTQALEPLRISFRKLLLLASNKYNGGIIICN